MAETPPGAPAIVVGTPAWQHHELGSLLVSAAAKAEGWRVVYLGPNLPANELATAVIEVQASVVALSITYVDDFDHLVTELSALDRLLPEGAEMIVGGRGAGELAPQIGEIGARYLGTLADFREELERVRTQRLAG